MTWEKEWSSHIPLLIKVMEQSDGPVLELGAGPTSTPLLYWLCFDQGREFHSYDNNPEYVDMLSKFGVKHGTGNYPDKHWGMVFIDHEQGLRANAAANFAQNADYVVIHDSQRHLDKYFHYKDIYHLFKYRWKYGKVKPHTTVLSNFKDFQW